MQRILFALSLAAALCPAQELLISAEALQARLQDPELVLIHSGGKQDYDAGHIPGALLVTLADLSTTGAHGLRLELPPVDVLRESLLKLGVSDKSKIVIYTGNESVQSATRLFFTFDYLSLPAAMLNGGLAAWKAKGFALSTEESTPRPATSLQVQARPELVVDAAWVEAHRQDPQVTLIDARLPEFYSGENAGQMARGGRIPGARNVPFLTLIADDKTFLLISDLASKLGGGGTIVTYCHIGMQATVPYFAARLTGKTVKLYDGSFQDWAARSELPVAAK